MSFAREVRDFLSSYKAVRDDARAEEGVKLKRQALENQAAARRVSQDNAAQSLALRRQAMSLSQRTAERNYELGKERNEIARNRATGGAPTAIPTDDWSGAAGPTAAPRPAPSGMLPGGGITQPMPGNMPAPGTLKMSSLDGGEDEDVGGVSLAMADGDDDDEVDGENTTAGDFDMVGTLKSWGYA